MWSRVRIPSTSGKTQIAAATPGSEIAGAWTLPPPSEKPQIAMQPASTSSSARA